MLEIFGRDTHHPHPPFTRLDEHPFIFCKYETRQQQSNFLDCDTTIYREFEAHIASGVLLRLGKFTLALATEG